MSLGDTLPDGRLQPFPDMTPEGSHLLAQPGGEVGLKGSQCADCGTPAFPARNVCMVCGSRDLQTVTLPQTGRLYSATTVHVSSSRPVPYSIGYIDLDNGVRLLAGVDPAASIDQRVKLVVEGENFHFAPAGEN